MTLRTKFILSFTGVLMLLVLTGGANIYYLQDIQAGARRVAHSNIGEVQGAAGLTVILTELKSEVAEYLLNANTRHEPEASQHKAKILLELTSLNQAITLLETSTDTGIDIAEDDEEETDENEEREKIILLTEIIKKYEKLVTETLSQSETPGIESVIDFYNENKTGIESAVLLSSNQLYNDAINEIEEEAEEVIFSVDKAMKLTIFLTIAAFLIAICIGLFISWHITKRILALQSAAKEIQNGNFTIRLDPGSDSDEITNLTNSFNLMAEQLFTSTTSITELHSEVQLRREVEAKLQSSHDMLEQRVIERTEQLEHAKQEAENSNRAKSDFLANMSHELRTPLNHIIGFTELITDEKFGSLNEIQKEYLGDSLSSGKHLLTLINDILDLSKVEAGKLVLQTSDVDILNLIKKSMDMFKEKAMKHNLNLKVETENIPDRVLVDEIKMKQILYNLVSNAVKFTPDGGSVCLKASVDEDPGDASDHSLLTISVIDSGIGIVRRDLLKIFKPFEQLNISAKGKNSGTGLGLSLTKKFVELHGGEIQASSKGSNSGSSFKFTLPIKPVI